MKTVGEILKNARLNKKVSFRTASQATKIHAGFLQALEKNEFDQLPSLPSARGFLKNYAEFLGLSSEPILAIFRRDFGQRSVKTGVVPQSNAAGQPWRWQPKLTVIVALTVFFAGVIGFLAYQYFSLAKQPPLELWAPEDKQKISGEKVEILGKTDPDATVTINGQPVFLTTAGEFRYKLELFSGENKIVVEAQSRLGKKATLERVVFRP